jgi:hypothetical protein
VDTPVYQSFTANIDRSQALIRIFERGRSRGRPRKEDTQLTRSSLVFSIGALDAYLHDLVLDVVGKFVPESDELDRAIKEMDPRSLVQNLARAQTRDQVQERFRRRLDEHFDDVSFMDVKGLQRAMGLVGCPIDLDELAVKLGRPKFKQDLGRYTDQRHRIIHRGENIRIKKEHAEDCVSLVWHIVVNLDAQIASKYYV